MIKHRDELGGWLNDLGLVGDGAEIGCAFGGFSRIVLNLWKGQRYFMVDLWASQDPSVYRERQQSSEHYECWFKECSELKSSDPRVTLLRLDSISASKLIDDHSLDFVYLDANHSFEAVANDLEAWWKKVKSGGILGGHDFMNKTDEGWYCQVEQAVLQWTALHSLEFTVTDCSSFWVRKT